MNLQKIMHDLDLLHAHNNQIRSYKGTFQNQINELQSQLDECEKLLLQNKIKEIQLTNLIFQRERNQ